jgi:DNA polymerase-3 subunit delta'
VALIPLYGHETLRARLAAQHARGALPSSLLFQGPAGVGKQRLALWLAQLLVCDGSPRPCGECQHCRYALALQHRDIHWMFPHASVPNGNDKDLEALGELQDARVQERAESSGLYPRPDGSAGIFRYDTRLLVHAASRSPALAKRKVLIVGDAERMVSQAASQEAANAFLKLLEEPPADTSILLTSSEPGALLPTIRSRVVSVRVPPLPAEAVRAFLADPLVAPTLPNEPAPELVRLAAGAPGTLIGADDRANAIARARQLLAAADAGPEQRLRAAFAAGSSKARGAFTDVLDALTVLVHERVRTAAHRGDEPTARRAARVVPLIEEAKRAAEGNANPQLVTAQLLETMAGVP